jgi:hypothetical protein
MSPRPLAQGHRELMAQHQDLGVLPPRCPPRQAQHRHGPDDDEEDQLQAHKPKIIARQPEPNLPARYRSRDRADDVPQSICPGGAGFRHPQVELLRFFEKMTPAGPGAELSPSLADFGDAEVAKAEAAIEGRPTAAGPEAIPPVEAIAIPPVEAPDIKVPEITADAEQAERP